MTRRKALETTLAGATLSLATGVRSQPAPVLQIVGPWDIGGLAPASSGHVFTRMQVAETLVNADDDGRLLPGLAEHWSASSDRLSWRFVLRPTARFHDGTPVDAAAVVRCLEAARVAPALLSIAPVRAISAEGSGTVLIRLVAPYAGLPALLTHSSTLILAPSSHGPNGTVRAIVGTGPYRVAALTPPQELEATVFDGYDGPRPRIERVRYLAAGRSETRALMAESGQADLAYALDPVSLTRLRTRRQVRLATVTLPRTVILKVNAGLPALKDVRVRQALSLAIDRAGIAKALLRDPELTATQLFPPTLHSWHDASLPPLAHDPAGCARLLAEAGWQRAADGLRDTQGKPLQLTLHTYPDRPELPLIATALQEQWRQAGIAVQVRVGNSGDIPLGHRDGSLQLGLAARNYGTVPDPTGTLLHDFASAGGDWGATNWRSDIVVQALTELARGNAPTERMLRLRNEVARVLHAELPVIPITWYRQQVATSRRVTGVSLDPLERSYRLTGMGWQS